MSQSIRLSGFSYESSKGVAVNGLTIIPAGRFPAWEFYKKEARALLAARKALGDESLMTILRGFAEGVEYQPMTGFRYGQYQKHRLITLAPGKSKKEGLSFGQNKAKALVAVIDGCGIGAFAEACQAIVDGRPVGDTARKAPGGPVVKSAARKVESPALTPTAAPTASQTPSRAIQPSQAGLAAAFMARTAPNVEPTREMTQADIAAMFLARKVGVNA